MNGRPMTKDWNERDGDGKGAALSSALGWFGIGLGVAEIVAPASLARLIGVRPTDRNLGVMRAMGVREITSGLGILAQPRSAGWVWSRTAGDVMDLTLLQRARASGEGGTEIRREGRAPGTPAPRRLSFSFAPASRSRGSP